MLQIERAKFKVFGIFLKVPMVVIRHLLKAAQRSFEAKVAEMERDTDTGSVHSADDRGDDDDVRCLLSRRCPLLRRLTLEMSRAQGGIDWSAVEFASSEDRVISRNRKWSLLLCGRFSAPLVVAIVSTRAPSVIVGAFLTLTTSFSLPPPLPWNRLCLPPSLSCQTAR